MKTVTRKSLLEGGKDQRFRQLINDLFTLEVRMATVRQELASYVGLTPPEYSVLLVIARQGDAKGISVKQVADALHVTGVHVTVQTNALVAYGLITKISSKEDKRVSLLRRTPKADALLDRLEPKLQAINDQIFSALDKEQFHQLASLVANVVRSSDRIELLLASSLAAPPNEA